MRSPRSRVSALGPIKRIAAVVGLWLCGCATLPDSPSGMGDGELQEFLDTYFATWSAGDMEGYSNHFHDFAVIAILRDGRIATWVARDRFVSQQVEARKRSGGTSVERMLSYEASADSYAATVVARWELVRGSGVDKTVTRGVDRFTLVRDEQNAWKTVALVFYSTE